MSHYIGKTTSGWIGAGKWMVMENTQWSQTNFYFLYNVDKIEPYVRKTYVISQEIKS